MRIGREVVQVRNHTRDQEERHRSRNDEHKNSYFFGASTYDNNCFGRNTENMVFELMYITDYVIVELGR